MPHNALLPLVIVAGSFLATFVLIRYIVSFAWSPLARRYPAVPPRPDAIRRTMQTVRLRGWCGFNHCITIAADEDYLHLSVISVFRWLCGTRPVSIPWGEITGVSRGWIPGYSRATVAGMRFDAPRWCLELAAPDAAAAAAGEEAATDPYNVRA